MDFFRDLQKAFDPRKILEAHFGRLGTPFGSPFGAYGSFAHYSPKAYFNSSEFFNGAKFFDAKAMLKEAVG